MKKIPSLFVKKETGTGTIVTDELTPGCEWVLEREPDNPSTATRQWDGLCCLVRDGRLYRRMGAVKNARTPPDFELVETDPQTGLQRGWLPVGADPDMDRLHMQAPLEGLEDGTYELCGPGIFGNPDQQPEVVLLRHGSGDPSELAQLQRVLWTSGDARSFYAVKHFLDAYIGKGIVWHHPDGRMAKIGRRDYGFEWPRTDLPRRSFENTREPTPGELAAIQERFMAFRNGGPDAAENFHAPTVASWHERAREVALGPPQELRKQAPFLGSVGGLLRLQHPPDELRAASSEQIGKWLGGAAGTQANSSMAVLDLVRVSDKGWAEGNMGTAGADPGEIAGPIRFIPHQRRWLIDLHHLMNVMDQLLPFAFSSGSMEATIVAMVSAGVGRPVTAKELFGEVSP